MKMPRENDNWSEAQNYLGKKWSLIKANGNYANTEKSFRIILATTKTTTSVEGIQKSAMQTFFQT